MFEFFDRLAPLGAGARVAAFMFLLAVLTSGSSSEDDRRKS